MEEEKCSHVFCSESGRIVVYPKTTSVKNLVCVKCGKKIKKVKLTQIPSEVKG